LKAIAQLHDPGGDLVEVYGFLLAAAFQYIHVVIFRGLVELLK
jgi:hypothetical protein